MFVCTIDTGIAFKVIDAMTRSLMLASYRHGEAISRNATDQPVAKIMKPV